MARFGRKKAMSYLNAPATEMVASYCAMCSTPVVDARSIETGVGPDCRQKYGFAEALTDEQRKQANKLVHFIACRQNDCDEVRDALAKLEALDCTKIAARIRKRLYGKPIEIEVVDGKLAIKSPYNACAVAAMRGVPGRRWDGESKRNVFPAESWDALVKLFADCYAGVAIHGPSGYAVAGARDIERKALGLPEPKPGSTPAASAPAEKTTPIKIVRDSKTLRFAIWTPYDAGLVELMKATPGRQWDGVQKCNTFPIEAEDAILEAVFLQFGKCKLIASEGSVEERRFGARGSRFYYASRGSRRH